MLWLPITILAYAFNSVSLLMNKFLLSEKIKNPAVFTVFTCFLMVVAFILLPFDWQTPSAYELIIEIVSGFLFGLGILFMFKALKYGETSRVAPMVGSIQPIIVLPLAWVWLGEVVSPLFLVALFLIIIGSIAISYESGKVERKAYVFALISAVFFAFSIVTLKDAFNSQASFITPFVLSRFGSILLGFLLLLKPQNFQDLVKELKKPNPQSGGLFIISQLAGALSAILLNLAFAISVGVTALINAMQGLQYIFLLIAVVIITTFYPHILKEKISGKILIQKIIATLIIIVGLALTVF